MKQTLQLKLGQSLTMTPQLQQAIKLLQLSTLDLSLEIQQTLESNPMLELVDELEQDEIEPSEDEASETNQSAEEADALNAAEPEELDATWDEKTIPEELPVDSSWEDVYTSGPASTPSTSGDDYDFESLNTSTQTLQEHLHWQLNLCPMVETDRLIATAIIDAINPDGMLTVPVAELTVQFDESMEIECDEVAAVLKRIQQFDPTGVGAQDLSECLLLQLNQFDAETAWLAEAKTILRDHMNLLTSRDFAALMRKTKLSDEQLTLTVNLIRSLNPRPGTSIDSSEPEYVVPDVYVKKENNRWLVELNHEATPKLCINSGYANLVKRADSSRENTYLRDNLQEARWFLKSLQSRNETLLKVAIKIVEHQRGFLDYGEEAMKPLVLHDIADAVEMHESTISRVTNRKYMHTPRGIFELKYFFSSHVSTHTGGEVSSTAIRALIKKLTLDENPRKPLSDNKITKLLCDQNINVARRTVAKYRESMAIPPSNERKRLA